MPKMLERLQAQVRDGAPGSPVGQFVGWKLTEVGDGHAVIELMGEQHHGNSVGAVHGGILSTIAQVAMATAYTSRIEEGERSTTVELKINFLRPAPQGRLVARGQLVQQGRTIGLAECSVTDERGRLVARASGTFMTLRGEQAARR